MKRIESRANPFFKRLRALGNDATARRDAGVIVVEGVHLCDALLASGTSPIEVVVGDAALLDAQVVDLLDRAGPADRYVLDDALFAAASGLAQGVAILMTVRRPQPVPPDRIERGAVLLDRVQDPGNVGSILRSAAAAGIGDVWLSLGCAGAWSPKVVRAAAGAHFRLRLFDEADLASLHERTTLPWIATSPHATRSLFDVDLTADVVWLFGHEGQGVDPALADEASTVRIPQPGPVESLNVAASAAVCLFEQVRQRAGAGPRQSATTAGTA